MNFLKGKLQALGASTSAFLDNTSEKTAKKLGEVKGLLNKALESDPAPESTLKKVVERVYWMPFPEKSQLEPVEKLLRTLFGTNYKIWNLSEQDYEKEAFKGAVVSVKAVGYPHPTLMSLHHTALEVSDHLSANPLNVAVIHCQATGYRSLLAIGFTAFILKHSSNPQEAIELCGEVCSHVTYENRR